MMEETVSRIQRRNTSRADLQDTYSKLNAFIDKLNEKIVNRIQLVQQTYLEDYKAQVKEMSQELKAIRGVLDEELLRQRSNERLFYLEEERDFFRGQTMKLNEEVTALSKTNGKLKSELEQYRAEAANYKHLVYGLQKKIAKVHNDAFQLQRLNKLSTKMPSIAAEKQPASVSPTKTSLTRFSPLGMQEMAVRPMHKSVQFQKTFTKEGLSSELKRNDQILEQCIRDIKKKIFYRTATQKQRLFFNQDREVTFDKFTRTDKEELVRNILGREEVLGEFYQFMVGKREGENSPKKSLISKSTFSDKIFKIKLCGIGEVS